jgi:hypothetical protein
VQVRQSDPNATPEGEALAITIPGRAPGRAAPPPKTVPPPEARNTAFAALFWAAIDKELVFCAPARASRTGNAGQLRWRRAASQMIPTARLKVIPSSEGGE